MSIRFKLLLCLGLLGAALLALGGSGFIALNQTTAKTRTIVADGVEGLGDLTRINDMYSNIVRDHHAEMKIDAWRSAKCRLKRG